MDFSFPHYLLSKQSVDDRALNQNVLAALWAAINPPEAAKLSILEVGAGIGTMLARLLRWQLLPHRVDYTLVDEMPENIAFGRRWLADWAGENGWQVEQTSAGGLRLSAGQTQLTAHFAQADMFNFLAENPTQTDLLIAHAVLDLLPMPIGLQKLFAALKPGGLAWLTINFDGVTSLEPLIDPPLDALIERLYHESMETRPGGGDSQSGRHLFSTLKQVSAEILAAGASDWVVYPSAGWETSREARFTGAYPAEESYFLNCILHFLEVTLTGHPALAGRDFAGWLAARRAQVKRGELVYLAHQMDFLCRRQAD